MRASHDLKPRIGAAGLRLGLPASHTNALFDADRQSILLNQKLRVDFSPLGRMCMGMSSRQEDYELICLLCTRAGMIAEDVAAKAITLPPKTPRKLIQRIDALRSAAAHCQVILEAAATLARRP